MKNILIFALSFLQLFQVAIAEELSYSGRLVNANGSPVTGLVDLKFDVAYSGAPSVIVCTKTVNGVALSNGVFHVSLDIETSDCSSSKAFVDVLNDVPNNESVVLQVTDLINSKVYPHQALKSVPFSIQSNVAKTLSVKGTDGQVLKLEGGQWVARNGGGSGSVTEVQTGSGLSGGPITSSGTISIATEGVTSSHIANDTITNADINTNAGIARSKIAGGLGNHVVVNDALGFLSAVSHLPVNLGGTGAGTANDARTNLGLGDAATRNVGLNTGNILLVDAIPGCLPTQKIQKTLLAPYVFSCVNDNDSADASKLPLNGGTMLGGINMGGFAITNLVDPSNPQDAATRNYVHTYVASELLGVSESQWVDSGTDIYFSNKVGIGAVTPTQKLDVIGNIFLGSNEINSRQLQLYGRDSAGINPILGYYSAAGNPFIISTTVNNNHISFMPHGTGNVGIGTVNPTAKLEVAGQIKINGGSPGTGKVLTSDGSGLATWETPSAPTSGSINSSHIQDGSIIDADINASAAIAQSKIANLTTDLAGKQTADAELTAVASLTTNGVMVKTAAGAMATRTIMGTSNRVDVTNGDGIAGNPTININTSLLPSPAVSGSFLKSTGAGTAGWSALTSGDIITILGFTPVNKAGDTMTGALTLSAAPTVDLHAATKKYVDDRSQWSSVGSGIQYSSGNVGIGVANPNASLDVAGTLKLNIGSPGLGKVLTSDASGNATWLDPSIASGSIAILQARAATTMNITLSGLQTVDGISLNAGDKVLVMNQTALQQNGMYVVAGGSWTRATEMDDWNKVLAAVVQIREGTSWQGMTFKSASAVSGTVGVTNIVFGSYGFSTVFYPNVAFGPLSLRTNRTGGDNVAIGSSALQNNISGSGNIAIGAGALRTGTSMNGSIAIGKDSLRSITSGVFNVGVGTETLSSTTTGRSNVAFGERALRLSTTADFNSAFGSQALNETSTGQYNTAVGGNSMQYNQTGGSNVAIGMSTFFYNIALSEATAVGYQSMTYANSTTTPGISYNTALGAYSLYGSTTAANNTGTRNTALGHSALRNMTSGSSNVGVGYNAGSQITTGSNNVVIGSNTGSTIASSSNNILIADGAGSERVLINSAGFLGIGTSNPGARLEVAGQVKITGGSPGLGKVLTSDGAGLASWETPAAGGITALTGEVTASGSGSVAATIASNAVTSAKILDGTIVDADIANATISYSKLNITDGEIPIAKLIRLACLPGEVITSDVTSGYRCVADSSTDSTKVPLAGGTMTGALTLSGAPTNNLHAATKQYVDSAISTNGSKWTTSGSNIYRSSGNVGIGTTAPSHQLHVIGSTYTSAKMDLSPTIGFHWYEPVGSLSSKIITKSDGTIYGDLELWTSGTGLNIKNPWGRSHMFIQLGNSGNAGNIGIGTTVPTSKLHVESAADTNIAVSTTNSANSAQIEFKRGSNTSWFGPTPSSFDIWFGENNPFLIGLNGSERMRITPAGNMGIGSNNPNERLTVEGVLSLREGTVPSLTSNYGKLYTLSSDSKLYFMNDSGVAAEVLTNRPVVASTNLTINFTNSQMVRSTQSGSCGTLGISGTAPGKTYTLTMPSITSTCTLPAAIDSLPVKSPLGYTNGLLVAGAVYSLVNDGYNVWISYVEF